MLNETHDPRLRSWVDSANAAGQRLPDPESAVWRVPAARAARERCRGGVAIGDQILDLDGRRAQRRVRRAGASRHARSARSPRSMRCMAAGPAAWTALRLRAVAGAARRLAAAADAASRAWCRRRDAQYALPARHRRLHRFLHLDPSRDRGRPPVPPRSAADAELPLAADRPITVAAPRSASRASAFARPLGQRAAPAPASRRLLDRSQRLDYELELGVFIGRGNALGNAHRHRSRPKSTSSACACSTTGRRATCRPGSTSRSVRSSARISPPRSRRGS